MTPEPIDWQARAELAEKLVREFAECIIDGGREWNESRLTHLWHRKAVQKICKDAAEPKAGE